jgi:cytochrome b6-f complex iron-sulfur subunit
MSETRPPAALNTGPAPEGDSDAMKRRSFITWLSVGWIAFAGAAGGFLTMIIRFLFPNVLFEPPQSFKIGFPDDFQLNEVNENFKQSQAVWIIRTNDGLYALSTVCTHLGCTPNWLGTDNKFKCPCHGSGFRKSGINFEGPAPRPLERYKITLAEDGQIIVDKSVIFQYEKGQWDNPEAFLTV